MIEWMQRHKKYLVITIWIASIAFVGAGFVGWGSYNLNKNKATAVALVGDSPVSIRDYNGNYNKLFNYYYQMSGGKFTREQADKMQLKTIAFAQSIKERLDLNFAHDLGITATDEEIARKIVEDDEFKLNGQFNQTKYKSALKQAGVSTNIYEEGIKKQIILDKLDKILTMPATSKDMQMIASAIFMQDKISIEIVKIDKDSVSLDENELKKFWEKNKNSYMTKTLYKLDTHFLPVKSTDANLSELEEFYNKNRGDYKDFDDKILTFEQAKAKVSRDFDFELVKESALKSYISIKNGELKPSGRLDVSEANATFPINQLSEKKAGDTIKPIKFDGGYLIAKIASIEPPRPMEYSEAREFALKEFTEELNRANLKLKAENSLKNFKGRDIGFVSRDFNTTIQGLDQNQTKLFLGSVFSNNSLEGIVDISSNSAVVYKITEQIFADEAKSKAYEHIIKQSALNIKNEQLKRDIAKELEKRYPVQAFFNPEKGGNSE